MTIEFYDCGCKLRSYEADHSEMAGDGPNPVIIVDLVPCSKHLHSREVPPSGARLLKVQGEHEAFLNE